MTQAVLSARLDMIAALLTAIAAADALGQVELLARLQQQVGLALRVAVLDAREHYTVREVAAVLGLPHSVLIRQLAGGPVTARAGRCYYRSSSRNAPPPPLDAELSHAS